MNKLCPYGSHRVIAPQGALPQAAQRIDNRIPMQANELLIQVETLNVDSASFTQIRQACGDDRDRMAAMILDIVNTRGKLQNPVTGSGGMLLGRVKDKGADHPGQVKPGDAVATLVSLSLTPLRLERIKAIHMDSDQVDVEGEAILFETGIFAVLPPDIPQKVALAALDVAGAPAQTHRLVKPGNSVLVLGASGKSGVLCCVQAKLDAGPEGRVIGLCYDEKEAEELRQLQACDVILMGDARKPLDIYHQVLAANRGEKVDLSISVVNIPDSEMSAILPVKQSGTVYFFSMATHFAKAALGAEGVASDARMLIGNGYIPGHGQFTLDLLRSHPGLMKLFASRYDRKD